jgi:NAD(P)-dependent dehydrogenase (short-subunit alcohol dehydrogenase family)
LGRFFGCTRFFLDYAGSPKGHVISVCKRIDPEGARTLAVEADVRDPHAIELAVRRIVERFGKLSMAVNNAGVTGPAGTLLQDLDPETWRDVIDTDLTGVFDFAC